MAAQFHVKPEGGIMNKRGTPPRPTDGEYVDLAADYDANPITADEVLAAEVNAAFLPTGWPTKAAGKGGKTPVMALRRPAALRAEIKQRVAAGESRSEAELIRRALIEYLEAHRPAGKCGS
ncbi:MAG TPA: hypothetical protein PLD01_17355 [Mycobacterium sp.]|nr:hypothetical protein [Mycobacterium sp.]